MRFRISVIVVCITAGLAVTQSPADANRASVKSTIKFTMNPGTKTDFVKLTVLVPQSIPNVQKIDKLQYSLPPTRSYEKDGASYAEFEWKKPSMASEFTIMFESTLYRRDWATIKANKNVQIMDTSANLKNYLSAEKFLEVDDAEIQNAAKSLLGKGTEETVRKTLTFVTTTVKKGGYDDKDNGAVATLKKKTGDCSDFTDLFVSLLRANKIPARVCDGYLITDIAKNDTPKHSWAEVYLPTEGWVPIDPFHVHLGAATIDRVNPTYIYLLHHRNNPTLGNYHFWYYTYNGSAAKFNDEFQIVSRKYLTSK